MKSIFWSGGWTRTIDLQGYSPGALLLSYATCIYINYAQWAILRRPILTYRAHETKKQIQIIKIRSPPLQEI